MRDSGEEFVAGTTGPGSNAHDMPLLLKEFAGLKIRLVAGYAANSDILLAVERNEVDGHVSGGQHDLRIGCSQQRSIGPLHGDDHEPAAVAFHVAHGLTDELSAPIRARWPLDPEAPLAIGAGVKA